MRKLMGYLAQFASFSKQGELLCTQSLTYLLMNMEAQCIFTSFLGAAVGSTIPETLTWRTEHCQSDGARPDVEGCRADGVPVVKIEGKIGAAFGERQLTSYMKELCGLNCPGNLILLVPRNRHEEATNHAVCEFALKGEGPWQVKNVSLTVITWEDLLQNLGTVVGQSFQEDLAQLHALYRALNGDDMEPLTTDEQVLLWREQEAWWAKLVDITTRRFTLPGGSLLPLGLENAVAPYYRRYICRNILGVESCYSVGTRDPFQNHHTPLWLRFHRNTGHFQVITQQLEHSPLVSEIVRSGKDIWYPLEVPYNAEREVMVESLVSQIRRIVNVAYQFTTQEPPRYSNLLSKMIFSEEIKSFIECKDWTFAKTMPQWPHEYLVRDRVDSRLFELVVKHLRKNGYQGYFYERPITYYEESGWVYWTMGAPIAETVIINRCRTEDSYESRAAAGTLPK
ncbi:hypothetical protein [Desulfotalea psychrophila]|uniref:Uncharacterized protein n=1 Tax=Desulfotalea psychrophila (strain LSv54 / DSM 12343) TaxID=177439 RepID=Q6AIH9_DESPS|nr:hypothetical protein [Desulfotalea psychrophila]CAG37868.1 unknown protein [Desulfotalea psychrophila LSv54]